ncbi:hypothetical protein AB0C87_24910 [Actinomadura sp. NPDC048021]|uniref:hypothetical protein n=1 Tax=Actinomadura sp. NPDC048021 TaxID=3155385 RepID=UPI0033D22595
MDSTDKTLAGALAVVTTLAAVGIVAAACTADPAPAGGGSNGGVEIEVDHDGHPVKRHGAYKTYRPKAPSYRAPKAPTYKAPSAPKAPSMGGGFKRK